MRLPVIRGIFDRRILISYRIDPEVAAKHVPAPFQPKIVRGHAVGSICMIRLRHIRPRLVPAFLGLSSENVAHRFAVEWEDDAGLHEGVYIPRRDTSSRLTCFLGGRLFPGCYQRADFHVHESMGRYQLEIDSIDRQVRIRLDARVVGKMPASELFDSLPEHSEFIRGGSTGYSATPTAGRFDGMQLHSFRWNADALEVGHIQSSFFDNRACFPAGSIAFDSAILMRGIEHEWHGREPICCDRPASVAIG